MDYNYYEQQNDWLQKRCGKFTASDIHKLLEKGKSKCDYFGKGALGYIRVKLAEILTGSVVEVTGVPAMEWGNSLELEAVQAFEKETGHKVTYWGKANPEFFELTDHSGGSPDGEIEKDGAIIEVKCPYTTAEHINHLLISDAAELQVEKKDYYAQIQMNMLARGRGKGYFISYDPRITIPQLRLKYIEVPLDEDFAEMLKERIWEAEKYLKVLYASLDEKQMVA